MSDASSSNHRPAISRRVWLPSAIIAVIGTAFGNKLGVTATALLMAAVVTWLFLSEYLSPGGALRKASGVRWLRLLAVATTITFPLTIAATGRWMDLIGTLGLATAATIICIVLLIAGLGIGWRQAMLAPIGWTLGPLIALWGSEFARGAGQLQENDWRSIVVGLAFLLGGLAVLLWGFTVLWGDQSDWCDAVALGAVAMLMPGVLGLLNRAFLLSTALVLGGVALLLWSVAVRAGKQLLLGISAVLGGLGALLLGGWLIFAEHRFFFEGVACIFWGSLLLIWALARGLAAEIPKGIVAIPGGSLIFLMGISSLLDRQSFSGTVLLLVGIVVVINSVHHATESSPQVRAWVDYLASRPVHPKRSAGSTSAVAASIPSPRRAIQGDRVSNFAAPAVEGDVDAAERSQ